MSATTSARNVGAAAPPEAGDANTRLAFCVLKENVNAGVVVAVATDEVNRGERFPALNEVTVPPDDGATTHFTPVTVDSRICPSVPIEPTESVNAPLMVNAVVTILDASIIDALTVPVNVGLEMVGLLEYTILPVPVAGAKVRGLPFWSQSTTLRGLLGYPYVSTPTVPVMTYGLPTKSVTITVVGLEIGMMIPSFLMQQLVASTLLMCHHPSSDWLSY